MKFIKVNVYEPNSDPDITTERNEFVVEFSFDEQRYSMSIRRGEGSMALATRLRSLSEIILDEQKAKRA